jgi:UDP-2,3-diacylglucosamine pyrophosphatase LpxH
MIKHTQWTDEEHDYLVKLKEQGYTYQQIADELTAKFNQKFTFDGVRNRYRYKAEPEDGAGYKETTEILADGSHKSDKLLRMSAEQSKDVNYLLMAHGFDTEQWELVNAKNNIWNVYSKEDKVQTLYSSRVTVKPRQSYSLDKLLETIKETQSITIKIDPSEVNEKRLLEIPLFDAHFGVSDYDYYKQTQSRIMDKLISRKWEESLFVLGQDMLHNDDFRGRTSNGTQIEVVDMVKAWEDARTFYEPLIEKAIKQSNSVKLYFVKGNHDESMSWAFVQLLKERYPQLQVDDTFIERKAYTFGNNFIGITHGDKARKNLHNIFPVEFPNEWANATNREIHIGHLHVEDAKDHFGMVVRTLATRNKTDKWHKDNGYVGAHKRFMLFEYSVEQLESIHYV